MNGKMTTNKANNENKNTITEMEITWRVVLGRGKGKMGERYRE